MDIKPIHCVDDLESGYDERKPQKLYTGSYNVKINKKRVGRETDIYNYKCDDIQLKCIIGSKRIRINNIPVMRVDDIVNCNGHVITGQLNVKG